MNQVGDIVLFSTTGTGSTTPVSPIYVWKFWDGAVQVTTANFGSVTKRLNIGGNPSEGGSAPYVLPFHVEICDPLGLTLQYNPDTIPVNNPPTIFGPPTVTPNNQAFPFTTQVNVKAYDLENNGVTFLWYYGTNPIGGKDTVSSLGAITGTYWGTLTSLTPTLFSDTLTTVVTQTGTTLTCKMVDGDGGTNLLNIPLQGFDPASPQFSVAVQPTGVTVDASTVASAVIAPNQNVQFTAYATDPTPGKIMFTWALYGTNGWDAPDVPVVSSGTTTGLPSGGYRNDFVRDISQESGDGLRTAIISTTNPTTGKTTTSSIDVALIQNDAPGITAVNVYDGLTEAPLGSITKLPSPARTTVHLAGTVLDSNADVVFFKWSITAPVAPTTYTLYGRDAYVDITGWPAGLYQSYGVVNAIDKFGAISPTVSLPQFTVN